MENTEYSNSNEETQLTNTTNTNSLSPKWVGVISYLTLVGWIIALVLNSKDKNEASNFHIRQSLGILGLFIVANVVAVVPILGWIACVVAYLLAIVLWFIGIVDAFGERTNPVPVLGDRFQEWFASVN